MTFRGLTLLLLVVACLATASSCFAPSENDAKPDNEAGGGANLDLPTANGVAEREAPTALRITPQLVDAAVPRGVDFRFDNDIVKDRWLLPEIMGGGAGWLDYDLDGLLDLYLVNGDALVPTDADQPSPNQLLRFDGEQFGEVAGAANAGGDDQHRYGQGCAVGDFNADGFPDLFISAYGPNLLLMNNGDGTFSNVSQEAGIDDPRWGTSCLATDLNEDGLVDIYLANYAKANKDTSKGIVYGEVVGFPGPGEFEAYHDCVFLNQGDGTFVESSESLQMRAADGYGLAVAALDFDEDGLVEVYVANDMTPNYMWTRSRIEGLTDSDRPWHEVARALGSAVSEEGENEASMGIACEDFDEDGLADIFLTHFADSKSTLYRNLGSLAFEDFSNESQISRISRSTLGFGVVPFDYNRDGAMDLFVTNGHVLGDNFPVNEMQAQLFQNQGRGRFEDLSEQAGPYFERMLLGRGAAGADFDNDGDVDILVTHVREPYALLENQTETPHATWIGFQAIRPDRSSVHGAVVTVKFSNGTSRSRQFQAGGSYLCTSDPRVLFAAPRDAEIEDVQIRWRPGDVQSYGPLPAGQYWRLVKDGQAHAH